MVVVPRMRRRMGIEVEQREKGGIWKSLDMGTIVQGAVARERIIGMGNAIGIGQDHDQSPRKWKFVLAHVHGPVHLAVIGIATSYKAEKIQIEPHTLSQIVHHDTNQRQQDYKYSTRAVTKDGDLGF
jgi:hypothetical protein